MIIDDGIRDPLTIDTAGGNPAVVALGNATNALLRDRLAAHHIPRDYKQRRARMR